MSDDKDDKKESQGFKVTDRRKFDSSGNLRKPDAGEEQKSSQGRPVKIGSAKRGGEPPPSGGAADAGGGPPGEDPAGPGGTGAAGGAIPFSPAGAGPASQAEGGRGPSASLSGEPGGGEEAEQEVDFSAFIMSMATGVLMALGEVPDPMTGRQGPVHLESARHTIDILSMLNEKTRGNLDAEEERIMKQVLYELRMKYMEVVKKLGK